MARYFREIAATEDGFAEPVQFVGVYALRWRDHPEQPTIAFVETDVVDDLAAAAEQAIQFVIAWAGNHPGPEGQPSAIASRVAKRLRGAITKVREQQ